MKHEDQRQTEPPRKVSKKEIVGEQERTLVRLWRVGQMKKPLSKP